MIPKATMLHLAETLNLSPSTISRALSDHPGISAATKKRVQTLAQRLNYQPNTLATALRTGRSNLLGVIVPEMDGCFFSQVVKGIESVADKAGYTVLVRRSNEDAKREQQSIDLLLNAQVAGLLVSLSRTTYDRQQFNKVHKRGLPLVFFDRVLPGSSNSAVVIDDYKGAFQATDHLIREGCCRIAHFAGPQHLNIYRHRRQGYLDALSCANMPVDEQLICYGELDVANGVANMRYLLELTTLPDAVFAASDFALVGALQVLKEQQIQVPQQIALVGFSNESFTCFLEPQLTSVDQCCEQMGHAATRLLLEMLQDPKAIKSPRQVVLKPKLCVRNSSSRA